MTAQARVRLLIVFVFIALSITQTQVSFISAQENNVFRSDLDGFEITIPINWNATSYQHSYVFYSSDLKYELDSLVQGAAVYIIVFPDSNPIPPDSKVVIGNDRIYLFACEASEYEDCPFLLEYFLDNFRLISEYQPYVQPQIGVMTSHILKMPFNGTLNLPWAIVQGYNTGTHLIRPHEIYSLDLNRDSSNPNADTEKEPCVAPVSGPIAWGGFPSEENGCISIKTDIPELGGQSALRTKVCHILYDVDFRRYGPVQRGQGLGYIAPSFPIDMRKGNYGTPHIHITLYRLQEPGNEGSARIPIPFTGAGGLDQYDFPEDGTSGQWTGFHPIYSTNYGFCANLIATESQITPAGYCNYANTPLDVFLIVDLSGSFTDDLPYFKSQAPGIISNLKALYPDSRFGLGSFQDYPIYPFGSTTYGDKAFEKLADLTFDTDLILNTIQSLPIPSIYNGSDEPESQLAALFQAASGVGQNLSGVGYPGASIPPGQQADFSDGATKLILLWTDASFHHPGDAGDIPYPGPSFAETVDSILTLPGGSPKVIGIFSSSLAPVSTSHEGQGQIPGVNDISGLSDGLSDLKAIAAATGALAPIEGVDCDDNGIIDIAPGQPLVCSIASTGEGISEAIKALVDAGTKPPAKFIFLPVVLKNSDGSSPPPSNRLSGIITDNGTPVEGTEILLRYYNGSSWSTYATTTTGSNGNYQFNNLPNIGTNQSLYVLWFNNDGNPNRLSSWSCWTISSSTTNPNAYRCNFDLDNVELLSPIPGATVALPYTFMWNKRPITTDDYELNMADIIDYDPYWWTNPSLGYVNSYTLNGLPTGFVPSQQYGWWMYVYGPNGYGISYYYHNIIFSNTGITEVEDVPMSSRISKETIEEIAPPQSR